MAFTKISNSELNSRGATTLPNQPTISAAALKQEFDAPAKNIVAPKFNNLIDELQATTGAASLGAVAPTGRTGATVQAVINGISSDLATAESTLATVSTDAHTHANKALLDTYAQSETDLADAVTKKHDHANKALLDTYTQTETDLADAVAKKHDHANKALLDTYAQTEADLADAVSKKHDHANKALLDTYAQTESDLADAVSKKHTHTNKVVLDDLSDNSGTLNYKGNPISGGGDAYKTVKVGTTNIVASGSDTLEFVAGSNVTLTPNATNKTITITSTGGGGGGGGDMYKSVYDSNDDGIVNGADTATTLTGLTASVAELNILDGVTATATEINVLDGITATTTELNYVDGVTSDIQTQLNSKVDSSSLATVATTGAFSDLTGQPTVDQTYDGTSANAQSGLAVASALSSKADATDIKDGVLTIQQNGTSKGTFTANSSTNATVNITTDDWVATASVSSGSVTFSGVDDSGSYGYDVYFDVDNNSTEKNPYALFSSNSGAGTSSMSVTYTTNADNGTNNAKLRRIK